MIHDRRRRSPATLVLTDKVVGSGSMRVRARIGKVAYYPCGVGINRRPTVMVMGRTRRGESLKP
jgi:hypothetical protein